MKHKLLLLTWLLFSASFSGISQSDKPVMAFQEKEFNFGTFSETTGVISYPFRFTNTGKKPLIISDVKASCGCTVPEWPREPILPGRSGTIKVSYNPAKQNGAFNKTIQVSSNADAPVTTLVVKGVVIPAQKVEEAYRFAIGDIRLQTIYAAFGEIYKDRTATFTIHVFNTSRDKPVTLGFANVPPHLNIRFVPQTLEPQQDGRIEMEYLTAGMKEWDYVVDRLELLVNGMPLPTNRINITANIREDFSTLTAAELQAAPRAEFDGQQFDFGTISDKDVVEHGFKLTNTGKSDLFIRKVSASCGCTAVQPEKTRIRPGESTLIKARFIAAGREGNQKKAVTVITNDPRRSKSILWINGIVEKP